MSGRRSKVELQADEQKALRRYQSWLKSNPVDAVEQLFGFRAWSKQREILNSLRDHKRTAVRSSHGVGKTSVAARGALWFLIAHPQSRVITTAPTWAQVEQLLWREMRTAWAAYQQRQIDIGIGRSVTIQEKISTAKLELADDWFAIGLSTDQPERFQGHHAHDILLVVDEASGVEDVIYEAAEGFMTSAGAKMLLIGNPTKVTGYFNRAFQMETWNRIHISAFDTPAFTGEDVSAAATRSLVDKEWVENLKNEWGDDSAQYTIRVLGEFADTTGRQYFHTANLNSAGQYLRDPIKQGIVIGEPAVGGRVKFVPVTGGNVRIWDLRKDGHHYLIFADCAGGVSDEDAEARPANEQTDASCAYVVDLADGTIVAEFHDRIDSDLYGDNLARLGRLYNTAEIVVETTGGRGDVPLDRLRKKWNYPALYRRETLRNINNRRGRQLGWDTNATTRPQMLEELQAVLRDDPARLSSRELLHEMRSFVWSKTGTKAQAGLGAHDDRVIAAAGAMRLYTIRCQKPVRYQERPSHKKMRHEQKVKDVFHRAPRVGARPLPKS